MNSEDRKIGAGHAAAMARLGLHEVRNAFYTDSNVAQRHGEYGIYGNATPQEIVAARGGGRDALGREADQRESVIDDRLQQAEARVEQERQPKDLERG